MPLNETRVLFQPLARRDKTIWVVAVVLFAVLEFLVAREAADGETFTRLPTRYYHFATEAILSGQLSLKIAPPPGLLTLRDPYDPALNQPYRLHDISLYRGKFYLYWGLSPCILFFAPFRVVTGWWPSEPLAAAFLGVIGIAALSRVILAIRRAFFPSAAYSTAILAVCALSKANHPMRLAAAQSRPDRVG